MCVCVCVCLRTLLCTPSHVSVNKSCHRRFSSWLHRALVRTHMHDSCHKRFCIRCSWIHTRTHHTRSHHTRTHHTRTHHTRTHHTRTHPTHTPHTRMNESCHQDSCIRCLLDSHPHTTQQNYSVTLLCSSTLEVECVREFATKGESAECKDEKRKRSRHYSVPPLPEASTLSPVQTHI